MYSNGKYSVSVWLQAERQVVPNWLCIAIVNWSWHLHKNCFTEVDLILGHGRLAWLL